MLFNIILNTFLFNNKPKLYLTIKNIKKIYYENKLWYDIYKNENIIKNKLLTAEHIHPQSFLKQYTYAKKDMHNIFLTNAETNIYRSNYKFTDNYKDTENNYYIPCEFSRGQISRTLGYMKLIYPNISINNVIDEDILLYWNNKYKPHELEFKRNNIIQKIQGNYNPFIINYKLLNVFFYDFLYNNSYD